MSGKDYDTERWRERPKDGYIELTPAEIILDAWAAEMGIFPRYAYRLLQAARLMVESRDAATNTRRKHKRAGQRVNGEKRPTFRLAEAQKMVVSRNLEKDKAIPL